MSIRELIRLLNTRNLIKSIREINMLHSLKYFVTLLKYTKIKCRKIVKKKIAWKLADLTGKK